MTSCYTLSKTITPIPTLNDEHTIINNILNSLTNVKFEDEYSVINNGVNYKLGNDSKIISKIYEIIVIDHLKDVLKTNNYDYIENNVQNKYPDFIIVSKVQNDKYYAVDIKSTYIKNDTEINGFTLGTYNGYFRNRTTTTSIVKPYDSFVKHYCICVIYERTGTKTPVKHLLVREKWQIARNATGSGNTCNIGSVKTIRELLNNESYFETEHEFDTFWSNYNNSS